MASGERIVSLQVLRFAAATMVVVAHSAVAVGDLTGNIGFERSGCAGVGGVDIFFVLSGLVIMLTGPLAHPRPTAARFALRRFVRVAPMFWLASLATVLIERPPLTWPETWATLFVPFAGGVAAMPYLKPGWSLAFEMVFYASVALLMIGARIRRNLAIGALALAALIAARLWAPNAATRFLVNPLFLDFVIGAALACVLPWLACQRYLVGWLMLAGAAVLIAPTVMEGIGARARVFAALEGDSVPRMVLFTVPAILLVAGCVVLDRLCAGPVAKALARMGDASYSIYLVHTLAIDVVFAPLKALGPLPLFVIGIGVSLIAGAAAHQWVERPLLRVLRRLVAVEPAFGGRGRVAVARL